MLVIEPDVFADERGFFIESYNERAMPRPPGSMSSSCRTIIRIRCAACCAGCICSARKPQGKLLRVVTGHVWDVAVDVDPRSPTFRQWVGVDLTGDNHLQFYIPPGYAHGFCVLSDAADVEYKCTQLYDAKDEVGIAWNDPELAIAWPVTAPRMSDRDRRNPSLAEYLSA